MVCAEEESARAKSCKMTEDRILVLKVLTKGLQLII